MPIGVSGRREEQVLEETYDTATPIPHVCETPDTKTEVERSAGLVQSSADSTLKVNDPYSVQKDGTHAI